MELSNEYKYFAFISYKREDEQWAKWLQHKLEHYKLPSNLNGRADLPKEIQPVFRDQSDLAGGVLADEINDALEHSKYLIVICSPRAAQSEWVGKEVQAFMDMGRADKIIPFIIGGIVNAQNPQDECFPLALRKLPIEQELLGVNINDMGRDAAAVKVIAQMFGLQFDELWQRKEREQRRKHNWIIAASITGFLIMLGVASWIWQQNVKIRRQNSEIKEKEWKMMENQSRFVAEKATVLVEEGDSYLAERLLLDVLPKQLDKLDRPYTIEAEAALRKALCHNNAIFRGHAYVVSSVAFSPDDKKIVSTGWDCSSFVWDVNSGVGTKLNETTGTHGSGESCFSPNGKYILTAGFDVKVFDSETLQLITTLDVKGFLIKSATYSPDGNKIFVSTYDNTQVFDAKTYQPIYTFNVQADKLTIHSFSPDGKRLCCFKEYGDSHACIIDTDSGNKLVPINEDDINSMAFSPDGELVVTSSWNGKAKIWNAHSGTLINKINVCDMVVNDAVFSPDGKHIATASWDGVVRLWDVKDINDEKLENEYFGHQDRALSLAFSSDGSRLLSSSWDNTIRLWDIFKAEPEISKIKARYDRKVFISPDGQKKALINWGKPVRIISTETGNVLYKLPKDTWQVHTVDFSPDGKTFATASQDYTVRIWDVDNGQELDSFAHNSIVYSAAFSPDGIHVASGTGIPDRKVRIWNTITGQPELIIDLPQSIYSLTYSPDGNYLACLLSDETLLVLNAKDGIKILDYDIPTTIHDKSDVKFDASSIIVTSNGYQITYDFPPLQELIDQTRERFKDCPLTPGERRKYYLEY